MTNTNIFSAFGKQAPKKEEQTTKQTGASYFKSPEMIKLYLNLCESRNVTPWELDSKTKKEVSDEIQRLINTPYPPSPAQIDKINTLHAEICEIIGEDRPWKPGFLESLTGGREGSASALITKLIEKRKSLNDLASPTEDQINTLVEWKLCPAIPFEEFNIHTYEFVEKLSYWGTEYSVPTDLEKRPKRILTDEQFARQIKSNMKQSDAYAFISKHRGAYYEWKKTRITKAQINEIRKLEVALSSLYQFKEIELAVDIEGNEMEFHMYSYRDRKDGLQSAYTPLSEYDLQMLSNEEATTWIYQLSAERDDRTLSSIGDIYGEDQLVFNDKHKSYDADRTRTGKAKDQADARLKEYQALTDLIFKLDSIAGYDNEDLRNKIKESILGMDSTQDVSVRNEIMNLMYSTIDFNSKKTAMNDVGRLFTMSEETLVATDICEELLLLVSSQFKEQA